MCKLLISKNCNRIQKEGKVNSAFILIEINQPNNVLKFNIVKAEH